MLQTLEKYHKDGLLHKQIHPTLDLTIWNYSPKVQYERLWDDITLQCRGLVTNSKGDVVARPFKKFFNYEEHKPEDIPNEDFVVYEKMDGSLGILFYYEEELMKGDITYGLITIMKQVWKGSLTQTTYPIMIIHIMNQHLRQRVNGY